MYSETILNAALVYTFSGQLVDKLITRRHVMCQSAKCGRMDGCSGIELNRNDWS